MSLSLYSSSDEPWRKSEPGFLSGAAAARLPVRPAPCSDVSRLYLLSSARASAAFFASSESSHFSPIDPSVANTVCVQIFIPLTYTPYMRRCNPSLSFCSSFLAWWVLHSNPRGALHSLRRFCFIRFVLNTVTCARQTALLSAQPLPRNCKSGRGDRRFRSCDEYRP